jgi:DNA repair exonuclease SbcCD nuclease subunit
LKERGKEALTTNLVQNMMKEVAVNSGFADKANNGNGFNPLGPHALRESFGSIMINSGVPDTIVDFWLGHEIGEMAEAYKGVQSTSLIQMYLERENLLTISSKENIEELKEKLKGEIHEENKQLQTMVNGLVFENMNLKQRISRTEQKLAEVEKLIEETLDL